MGKYLNKQELKTILNLGKTVEVFLGRIHEDPQILTHLAVSKTDNNNLKVVIIDSYDEGNSEFTDIYEFSFVNPDMDFETHNFEDIDKTIDFIKAKFKLNEIKFINEGICQDEYVELLNSEGQ